MKDSIARMEQLKLEIAEQLHEIETREDSNIKEKQSQDEMLAVIASVANNKQKMLDRYALSELLSLSPYLSF